MSKRKILIVDDEEMICSLAKEYLETKGYEVLTAPDGKKGLEEAKSSLPDLVVLDVNMPKMNGFQVLENLKKDKNTMTIPVFMLTARKSEEDVRRGIEHMADRYIPKPFTPEALLAEIEKSFSLRGL